jgi:hypothetical protein
MTTYDPVLKDQLAPAVEDQVFNKTILLKRLQRTGKYTDLRGRKFIVPLHTGRNEGVGARAETGTKPTARNQQFADAEYTPKYNWGSISLTQVVITATKGDDAAFVRAISSETRGMAKDLAADINRQAYGDGTGLLETCGTTTASTTVQLASTAQMKHLRVGMYVDVLVKASGATSTGCVNSLISAIDKTNKTITIAASVTTDNTFGVYRTGNYGLETMGLAGMISDSGTIGTINSASADNEYWRAYVNSNGGTNRSLTEILMQTCFDAPAENHGGDVSLMITSFGVRRAYMDLLTSMKRFTGEMVTKLEGGFSALLYNDKPLVTDRDAPNHIIWYIDEDHLEFAEMAKPSWKDDDGSVLKDDGNLGYYGVYYWFSNMVTNHRGRHAALKDITEK